MRAVQGQIQASPAMVTPSLRIADPVAAYWFRQVILRLRREVAWCWHQRAQAPDPGSGVLPPVAEAAAENLDLIRFENQKRNFFATDSAAGYLSAEIDALRREDSAASRWQFMAESLQLNEASQFVLGLALAARLDAALALVFATCLNDLSRPFPTLALAQRLWEDPVHMMACADPEHPLYRHGLLAGNREPGNPWQCSLDIPAMVARQLIEPEVPLPEGLELVETERGREFDRSAELLIARLQFKDAQAMQIVPLLGPKAAAFRAWAAALGWRVERRVVAIDERAGEDPAYLLAAACVCWLRGFDVLLPEAWATEKYKEGNAGLAPVRGMPLRWYVPMYEAAQQQHFPAHRLTPPLKIPPLGFEQRVEKFRTALGGQADEILPAVEECARRFRFEEQMIDRVAAAFRSGAVALTEDNLATACANEAVVELGNLAQPVILRFGPDELVLPREQTRQFEEILHAMQTLTLVHYHWDTAKVWNESGLSVLFCGSPGTGKTMAAEALATSLGLPMYRIDLSQVVNKYIGETEKNLKRIFDVAELSDCILFFDEADALFGKRTDVKDAHDRFANIEISYLLERMERFKGLAILATNRRKDLDEAFMRRLRFVIEFPVPGEEERKRIWRYVFPRHVDVEELDFRYLARQFQLSGGHIRSIAFNACLHAAGASDGHVQPKVGMRAVVLAVKRELQKMNRSAGDEVFGHYSHLIEEQSA